MQTELTYNPAIPLLDLYPEENVRTNWKTFFSNLCVPSSTVYKTEMEAAWLSIDTPMDRDSGL